MFYKRPSFKSALCRDFRYQSINVLDEFTVSLFPYEAFAIRRSTLMLSDKIGAYNRWGLPGFSGEADLNT